MAPWSLIVIALALVVGCGDAAQPEERVERVASPIVGGAFSDRSAIVRITVGSGDGASLCTGTLIAPDLVLTARHCTSRLVEGLVGCDVRGEPQDNSLGGTFEADIPVADIIVSLGAMAYQDAQPVDAPSSRRGVLRVVHDAGSSICSGDIAVLVLDRPVSDIAPLSVRLDAPVAAGEAIVVVGFGLDALGALATRRMERLQRVDHIGPSAEGSRAPVLPAAAFDTGESACLGDSGGPALSVASGAVVGVMSYGWNESPGDPSSRSAPCVGESVRNVFGATSGHEATIREAFRASAAKPLQEAFPPTASPSCALGAGGRPGLGSVLVVVVVAIALAIRRRVASDTPFRPRDPGIGHRLAEGSRSARRAA